MAALEPRAHCRVRARLNGNSVGGISRHDAPPRARGEFGAITQDSATRSRNEAVFRITTVDGQQRIVLADSPVRRGVITEAKYGTLGQM